MPTTGTRVELWPGTPPGPQAWTWTEQESWVEGERIVRNVSTPTLEVFAPKGRPCGAAVIVAPGGAFHLLAIDHEGTDLARWLGDRGVAAFVLRYRLARTPEDADEMARFQRDLDARIRQVPLSAGTRAVLGEEAERARALAEQDGRQAVLLVRSHAHAWGLDPTRIGFTGFSAGASVAIAAATSRDAGSRPDFAAAVYGPRPDDIEVPEGAPPLFLAHALDDPAVPPTESVAIWEDWRAVGRPAELHVFQAGGHGFGTRRLGMGTDAWVPLFEGWMRGLGLLAESGHPA